MNEHAARKFVRGHQPLSSKADLDLDLLDKLGAVLNFYRTNQRPEMLVELIGMVGDGDAGGYWDELASMLCEYSLRDVSNALNRVFLLNAESSAVWAADVVLELKPPEEFHARCKNVILESPYESVREKIAYALRYIASQSDVNDLIDLIARVDSNLVGGVLQETLAVIQSENTD